MQPVDIEESGRQPGASRYARGVQKLNPDLVERITKVLDEEPTLSKSELARRLGVSRQTVLYYIRAMGQQVEEAAARREEIAERRAITYLDLIERVAGTASEIEQVIGNLRRWPSVAVAGHLLRGYSALGRQQRLLAEMMGKR